jgi:hypothetical protein
MRARDLLKLLAYYIAAGETIMVTGAPGVGKSDILVQAAEAAKAKLIMLHPAISDPTDFKGMPVVAADRMSVDFKPFGDLSEIYSAKKKTVVFIDDLGQALPAVQAAVMQLLHSSTGVKRLNGKIVPACVTFVIATNRRTDGANVTGMLETVKSRTTSIVSLEPHADDFCDWAVANEMPAELIAYIRSQRDDLLQFERKADIVNQPCPRTWAAAGRILKMGMSQDLELPALIGAIGEGMAAKFSGYLRTYRQLPTIESILLNPDAAIIPTDPAALYFVSVGVAMRANQNNFGRVARYAERLEEEGRAEFAVLMVRDSLNRDPKVQNTQAFVKLTTGSNPVGRLIAGEGLS